MDNYATALEKHSFRLKKKNEINQNSEQVQNSENAQLCYLACTSKKCLIVPIYFVILISYLFAAKNYINKIFS